MKGFLMFLVGLVTDVKNRPEIKVLLGVPIIIMGVWYGVIMGLKNTPDWGGFLAITGLGTTLVFGAAVTDAINDSKGGNSQ